MIKLFLKYLTVLWISLFISNYGFTINLSQADLKNLFGEDFSAKQQSVERITDASPQIASDILFALQNENLYINPSNIVIIKTKEGFVDAITQTSVKVENESNLESPTLNNIIRSDIDSAVSQYKLLSKDKNIRGEAINTLSDDFSQIKPELVKKAYEIEVDPHLKSQLASLEAMVSYATADFSTKRELLKILGNSSLLGAQNFLANLIKKDESGNYVEKDKNLHPAIEMAFNEYKSRRFRAEVVSNIFTGLSLGSILLLAALGLAI